MRKCLFITGILLLQITRVHASTVGILMGTVVEKESGRGLGGANVVLVGTQTGAAADVEGKFVIYNVPAGLYTVKITVIGYRIHIVKNVRIIQDHKTKLVIELQQETIAGEEVIVIATRSLIQPELTSSIHFVSRKEIDHLPINSFEEIMELQPGVVSGGHIRGGRETEVLYLIDGIPVQQSIEGGLGADVPKGALEEITLQTGGFNAEYGNAMSGILNITTPAGSEQHRVWLRAVDDRLGRKESNKWRQYELFGSGPLYGAKASYFLSTDLTLSDTRWWQDMQKAFDSPNNKNLNLISKINIAFSPGERLALQGIYSWWDQRHTIAADLFAGDPEKYGMNIVWRWHSPRPDTYYPSRDGVVPDRDVRIEPNNARMFNVAYLDVKMSRSFWLKNNIEATLYLDYRNIFDRFNVLWIASDGKIGGELGDPTAYDQGRRFYLGVKIEFDRNR